MGDLLLPFDEFHLEPLQQLRGHFLKKRDADETKRKKRTRFQLQIKSHLLEAQNVQIVLRVRPQQIRL